MSDKITIRPLLILCSLSILLFSTCKKDQTYEQLHADPSTIIQDMYGRQLMLRGVNHSNQSKRSADNMPWITEADVDREDKEFGFNFVRLITNWQANEPQQGVYDLDYLQRYEERVNWYTSRGMYVLIDMHQNVYGKCVTGGAGHPDWACITDGLPGFPPDLNLPWWFNNFAPEAGAAWRNFFRYDRHPFIQDHFAKMWQHMANRFKDNPYVIGYDLMNEPYSGDLLTVLNGDFESTVLAEFYGRVVPAIRAVDPDKYIFFQPLPAPVTFGAPSSLSKIEDTRASRRMVYAPHLYPLGINQGVFYSAVDRRQLREWERERLKDQRRQANAPLFCGEFAVSVNLDGFEAYLHDVNTMLDKHLWHWAYWFDDWSSRVPITQDRQETAIMHHLVRTYPKATAGTIRSFSFDIISKRFEMAFLSNPSISQPTEIFIPKRHYPNGWNIIVEGTSQYDYTYDETKQQLELTVRNASMVKVVIEPK